MNRELAAVAEEGLKELWEFSQADVLTCYFLNPHSGLLWLFSRYGDVNYDAQMHGPLTYPGQTERLLQIIREHRVLEKELVFFNEMPPALSQSISGVPPFIIRESVNRAIWIVFGRTGVQSLKDTYGRDSTQEIGIILFLNYRASNKTAPSENLKREIGVRSQALKKVLQHLVDQPCILHEDAWRLRNMSLRFFRELEGVLVVGDEQIVGRKLEELCVSIVRNAFNLILPEGSENVGNVLCTLTMVDPRNQGKLLACYPLQKRPAVEHASSGIVDHVCRAGQIYMIEDTKKYARRWTESGGRDISLPKYVPCDRETCCELACPLIVGERIVGVLNIEANEPAAYKKHHILMTLQLASLAALVVRQRVLWESLSQCIDMQPLLFRGQAGLDDERILLETMKAAEALGYKADIWDARVGEWKSNRNRDEPRPEGKGYTAYISKSRTPIAIADVRRSDENQYDFTLYKGQLNEATLLFEKWTKEPNQPHSISKALQKDAEGSTPVLTDIGFPIFEDTGGVEGDNPAVRAVLWAKCHRRFMSLLHDETWALSYLCRNASMALGIRTSIRAKYEGRKTSAVFHFGETRGHKIDTLLQKNESLLGPKAARRIIVVNIDIRGSTEIGNNLLERDRTDLYVDFIRFYHQCVFHAAHQHGGVIDKTMGDGVQVLFNVYRSDVLDLQPLDTEAKAMENAMMCVLDVFSSFSEFWYGTEYQEWPWRGGPRGLGAGLALGDGFIGSFSGVHSSGMDYTIIGDVANRAGKLVSLARSEELRKWIKTTRGSVNAPRRVERGGRAVPVADGELSTLLSKLDAGGAQGSFLLVEPPPRSGISSDLLQRVCSTTRTRPYTVVNPDPGSKLDYLWVFFEPGNPSQT